MRAIEYANLNSIVSGFDKFSFKRRGSYQQRIDNDSNRPNINFQPVPSLREHFRTDIIGSSTNRPFLKKNRSPLSLPKLIGGGRKATNLFLSAACESLQASPKSPSFTWLSWRNILSSFKSRWTTS